MKLKITLFLFNVFLIAQIQSQESERPFILVKSSERDQILKKIKTKPWVNKFYKNPEKFLKQLPLNCNVADENEFPPFL